MQKIYLDNAATTPLAPEVKQAMIEAMDSFGNPSSTHSFGRQSRILVERSRKLIAKELHCEPGEVFFTSGGTEADNLAILSSVRDLGVKRIISLPTEHHAVLHTIEHARDQYGIEVILLAVDERGDFSFEELESHLSSASVPTLVSIMQGNNEIGNTFDMMRIGTLCREHRALYHSDTVQYIGHFPLDLSTLPVDFITCSAHKFNGPKGTGFLYARGGVKIHPQIFGGGQERNMRSGTENIIGIAGLGAAFQLVTSDWGEEKSRLNMLKQKLIAGIRAVRPDVLINGKSDSPEESLYTVTSIGLPMEKGAKSMTLFQFDMKGIAISGGSACNSGAQNGSHVIEALRPDLPTDNLRISMGRYTVESDVDAFLQVFEEVMG
ncbi:cysteine desulfurase family protein [Phaeocystidibacter marisrubri]|uniref:cysteine desulfurase n=1 Tax=Phaeocystidibacter marisrubri TaxID=1577780 RepID=A0A6L3ZIY3_9FLAO|nr:cysteine desulfurase family protein [Phaeocystidibacter marisrubri]KAB2817976.1 cysteine desulfurase [Phaeocystidibacter marisrubri]GGH72588.1 cysteine desulfurase [Phaeocystidibacter marisrubri]